MNLMLIVQKVRSLNLTKRKNIQELKREFEGSTLEGKISK